MVNFYASHTKCTFKTRTNETEGTPAGPRLLCLFEFACCYIIYLPSDNSKSKSHVNGDGNSGILLAQFLTLNLRESRAPCQSRGWSRVPYI